MENNAGVESGRHSWSSRKWSIVYMPSGIWHVWSGRSLRRRDLWFFVWLRYFISASRIYNNIRLFALLGRDTYFYHSLYDVFSLNYWCFVTKTVVCVACEDAGSPWGLDTEVRSWSKFSFSLLTYIRRGSGNTAYQNKIRCELRRSQGAYVCVCVCVCALDLKYFRWYLLQIILSCAKSKCLSEYYKLINKP
jgi:hypothetical protein